MENVMKVSINDKSVEKANNIKDFSLAIAQYIWNGFDAGATTVDIDYSLNGLTGVESIIVKDNGSGIDFYTLEKTFGILLDSQKKNIASSSVHGSKGSGRFAFKSFAGEAVWTSIFERDKKVYEFSITIKDSDKDNFEFSSPKEINDDIATGCSVSFNRINGDKVSKIITPTFIDFLKKEFGWFLHLNKNRNVSLSINNKPIDYDSIISNSENSLIIVDNNKQSETFNIDYIEWNTDIGDTYYYNYFLDSKQNEKCKQATSFNKNGIDFHHSVYIVSTYFDRYTPDSDTDTNNISFFGDDEIFKKLKSELHKYLSKKQKEFINRNADFLIQKLEDEKVFPYFGDSEYEIQRKNEFISLTKSIFRLQPKLFIKVDPLQKKSFLGLLKLVIDSDERDNIIKIIESIVNDLTKEERAELAKLLEVTKINKIVRTMKQTICRIKDIEILKSLVFDFEKYTTERDHIQKVMEECFWIFGEQYSLVSADKKFGVALNNYYIEILNKDLKNDQKLEIDCDDKDRRPDLFLSRQIPLPSNSTLLEENIIIELKRPSVLIGKKQTRQIQDYMDLIIKTPGFNGDTRVWKFYIVGKDIDEDVVLRLKNNQEKGMELFLYEDVGKYKIYAIKWDDLFQSFKLKNDFLLKNLDIDKDTLLKELENENIPKSEMPSFLVSQSASVSK